MLPPSYSFFLLPIWDAGFTPLECGAIPSARKLANDHKAQDLKIDSFQADRSPGHSYKTMNLAALFVRERGLFMNQRNKGRFYHDGRFQTLLDVVDSYNTRFGPGLTQQEEGDLVEYLKSL